MNGKSLRIDANGPPIIYSTQMTQPKNSGYEPN